MDNFIKNSFEVCMAVYNRMYIQPKSIPAAKSEVERAIWTSDKQRCLMEIMAEQVILMHSKQTTTLSV